MVSPQQFYDAFFQNGNILFQSQSNVLKVQDRVSHDLPRSMVSNVPSPVGLIVGGINFLQEILPDQQVGLIPAFTKGVDMRMLAEKQVLDRTLLSRRIYLELHKTVETSLLVIPRLLVIHCSQILKSYGIGLLTFHLLTFYYEGWHASLHGKRNGPGDLIPPR